MQRYNINNRLAYLSGGVQSHGGMWPSAGGAPTIYETNVQATTSNVTSGTYSITVPSGLTNSALVVCLQFFDLLGGTTAIDGTVSVNWQGSGGTALTNAVDYEQQAGSDITYVGWFYLVNPTADTNTIYWSSSRGDNLADHIITYFILENVHQTTPLNASNSGHSGGSLVTSLQASITGTSTNSLTFYGWSRQGGADTATVVGATKQSDTTTGVGTATDMLGVTASEPGDNGSQDATASWTNANYATWAAIQIEGTS